MVTLSAADWELPKDGKFTATNEFDRYRDAQEINLVFINGVFAPNLSNLKKLKGVAIKTIQQAVTPSSNINAYGRASRA